MRGSKKKTNKILVINFERCRPLVSFLASGVHPRPDFLFFITGDKSGGH